MIVFRQFVGLGNMKQSLMIFKTKILKNKSFMLREFGQDGELIDSLPTLDGICLDESESSPKK